MDWSLVRAGIVVTLLIAAPVAASVLQTHAAGPNEDAARATATAQLTGLASSLERLEESEGPLALRAYDDTRAWAGTIVHLRDTWPDGQAPRWAEDAAALAGSVLAWRPPTPSNLSADERGEVGLLAVHVRAAAAKLSVGDEERADGDLAVAAESAAAIVRRA